jgi:ATP-dependent Zn protease
MVTKWGFSDEIGIVYHGGSTGQESASSQTRAKIDAEVKKLTDAAYHRAKAILEKHRIEHKLLAETLLEYETLTGDEVRELVTKGIKPKRPALPRRKENLDAPEPKKRGFFGNKSVSSGER